LKWTTRRRTVQILSLFVTFGGFTGFTAMHLIYPFINCYACPLAVAACPVGIIQRFISLGQIPWYPLGVISIYAITLGRAFCGWACPFGLLQDMLDKVRKKKIRVWKSAHKKAVLLKFAILGIAILLAWVTADVIYCKICPPATIEAALPYQIEHGMQITALFTGRIVLFMSLMVAAIFITRFWCRYLCPFGALLAVFNRASLVQVNVDPEKCNECGACERTCPMDVEILKSKGSTECIKCGKCIDSCPRDATSFKLLGRAKVEKPAKLKQKTLEIN
jgi:ferredoxin-type protein NapH